MSWSGYLEFLSLRKDAMFLALHLVLIWGIGGETVKIIYKSFLGWLWPKLFGKPYPIPYKD